MNKKEFEKNSRASDELKAALYSMLRDPKNAVKTDLVLNSRKGYTTASRLEDLYEKIDVWYETTKGNVPFQIRSYGEAFFQRGFPVRDTQLVNMNEMQMLADGRMDGVYWVFASHVYAPSQYGEFKFKKVYMVKGEFLRRDMDNIKGHRNFGDGNTVSFIGFPSETVCLRDWS